MVGGDSWLVVVTAGLLVVVSAGLLVVVSAEVLVVGPFSDAAAWQPPIAAATTTVTTALNTLLRARGQREQNPATTQRVERCALWEPSRELSFSLTTDDTSTPVQASRRANTSQTGQNRAVPGDGDDHHPGPTPFVVAFADAVPALGNPMDRP